MGRCDLENLHFLIGAFSALVDYNIFLRFTEAVLLVLGEGRGLMSLKIHIVHNLKIM